jgi:hypothetical protein
MYANERDEMNPSLASSAFLLNPALPPYFFILQVPPWNDLCGLGKNSFDFYTFDGISGLLGLNHPTHQKVLLFVNGLDSGPFGQQQFFGVEGVHA